MEEVVELLKKNNKYISVMESCTGGCISNEITNIEGASEVFAFGGVTYSNEFKIKLGVEEDIIDKCTVYSTECAKEMSKKICIYSNSDYGIGVTGKLGRVDRFNMSGDNNTVYISIYDKASDRYYTDKIRVDKENRTKNKKEVVDRVISIMKEII